MTDYKQLCAELLNGYEILLGDLIFDNRLAKRARAALAEPEPELEPTLREEFTMILNEARCNSTGRVIGNIELGRRLVKAVEQFMCAQPESEGPTDEEIEEWADACPEAPLEELDPEVHGWRRCFTAHEFSETIRAAIARWGNHPGFPDSSAADGEMAGIVEWLKKRGRLADLGTKDWYFCAADLLERLSSPQPVPVSERLPGPGDCDAEGLCWVWNSTAYTWGMFQLDLTAHSHWLPSHALPQPS